MGSVWRMFWRGGRWCGHGVYWFVQVALLALAVIQGVMLTALWQVEEVAAPELVVRRINAELARYGWEAHWRRLAFDLRGYLRISGLEVRDVRLGETWLEAREVRLDVEFRRLLAGQFMLEEFRAEGVRLSAPTMVTGDAEPRVLLQDGMVTGRRRGHRWHVDHLLLRSGPMVLRATGVVPIPPPVERRPPPPPEEVRRQLLAGLGLAARQAPRLQEAGAWTISAEAAADANGAPRLAVRASLPVWEREAEGMRLGDLRVELPDLDLLGGRLPHGALVRWGEATGPDGVTMGAGVVRVGLGGIGEDWPVRRVEVAVAQLRHRWVALESAVGDLRLSGWPVVDGSLAASIGGRDVSVQATLDTTTWRGTVGVDSSLDVGAWLAAAPLPFDLGKYFAFGGPPRLWAQVDLGPGAKPERATARAELPRGGTILGWTIDRMSGRVTWDGRRLIAEDLVVENPGYRATGSYEEDFETRAYRLRARGTLLPADLNPLFGNWWDNLWTEFDFSAAPQVDLAIAGWWNGSEERYIWGRVGAEGVGFRNVSMDRLEGILRVEENYVDLHRVHGQGPFGELTGDLQFLLYPGRQRMVTSVLDLRARAALGALGRVAGPEVAKILEDFTATAWPEVTIRGWFHDGSREDEHWRNLSVWAKTEAPVTYRDVPLEHLELFLQDDGDTLVLDPVVAGFAGGHGTGRATFTALGTDDPRLRMELRLEDSGYAETLALLKGLETEPAAAEAAAAPESAMAVRRDPRPEAQEEPAPTGKITLTFAGEGRADAIASFTGAGDFSVRDVDFAHVQIFGALSRIFEGTPIGFSTVRLDQARGTYTLGPELIEFPDLTLLGPLSRADARGTMARQGGALDFRVRVFLLDEGGGIFSGILQPVFRPLGRIMELRLRGTLDEPDWRLLLDPRNLFAGGGSSPQ